MARRTHVRATIARLRFRPRRRHLLIVVGLSIAVVGNLAANEHGIGIPTVILFSLIPSLPLLLGIGQPKARGRLAARVVRPFNATHEPLVPLAIVALAVLGILPVVGQVGGLVWFGSIVVSWGLGDGLRDARGAVRPGFARMSFLPGNPAISRGGAAA